MPGKGMPDCPKWLLPEAKKEWERLCVKLSEIGVLTEIDMATFAAYIMGRYCKYQSETDDAGGIRVWVDSICQIEEHGSIRCWQRRRR